MVYARLVTLLLLLVLTAPTLSAAGDAGRNDRAVTVMTRNLYFGADLTPAIAAQTVPELIAAATHIFGVVQASDIPARAEAIADEIATARPDLVGLQEVALWRSQFPPDFAPQPNAATVEFDFLQLLLDALAARGAAYVVVAVHVSNDLEAPALTPAGTCCREIRLTDREVILVRMDRPHNDPLALSNVQDGTFAAQAAFPLPGGVLYREQRGWLAADVEVRGAQFRFVTTHLQPEGIADPIQVAQGAELVTGPANTVQPVIVVCDCNSRADGTGTATYGNLVAAGFADAWLEREPHLAGLTCCQAEDLRNPTSLFDQRIDLVLVRGRAHTRQVEVVGGEPADRTPDGLWPSDHAGVVATLQLKP
jgi:endonuclease/exonuclease/phosphatase family metal-dependent hydrolase